MSSTAKSIITVALISTVTLGFVYWRVQSHSEAQVATNGLIVDDVSDSVLNDPASVVGLAERALARLHLTKGSTLTVVTTGDGRTADEPRFVAKYEVPFSRRALEGKSALAKRKREILSDLADRFKKVVPANRSPIFLAVNRGIEQLRASGCTPDADCAMFVRTDGEELAEPRIKNAIEGTDKARRLPAPIPNDGIKVTICGLAETNGSGKLKRGTDSDRPIVRGATSGCGTYGCHCSARPLSFPSRPIVRRVKSLGDLCRWKSLFHSARVLLLLLILAGGFTMMISPGTGKKIFERAVLAFLGLIVALVALEQLLLRFPILTWIVMSSAAYVAWNQRRMRSRATPSTHRGAERTPVLPSSEHAE